MRYPYWLRVAPALLYNDYSVSPRVMKPEFEAGHSPYIVSRLGMNELYLHSILLCVHGVCKDNYTFTLSLF